MTFSDRMRTAKIDDLHLIKRIGRDDQKAFKILYERYWKGLYNYAVRLLRDSCVAEDVIQEVFVALWKRRQELVVTNLEGYLLTAVKNQCLNSFKKVKFTELHDNLVNDLFNDAEILEIYREEGLRQQMLVAVEELPERRQEIFKMSRLERLTIQEIAEKLNISPRTVENQLSLALQHLRKSFKEIAFLAVFVSEFFRLR